MGGCRNRDDLQEEWLGSASHLPGVCGTSRFYLLLADIFARMYNAVTRAMEAELVPCCRKFGLRIVVYNPLAYAAAFFMFQDEN